MAQAPVHQPDLFLVAVGDVPFRDGLDLMAVPIFGLGRIPRTEPIHYERGDVVVHVTAPADIGLATIFDGDVMLWVISQLNEAVNRGETPPPTVKANAYDVLRAIRRGTGGREYSDLRDTLDRLVATTIKTTIRAQSKRGATFSMLERVAWAEDERGRLKHLEITVPGWLLSAIVERRVLAIDERYFTLTSGVAKWLYRLARKQAGDRADGWRWTLAELHQQSGVTRPLRSFAADLRRLVKANELPEIWFELYADKGGAECLHAVRRSKLALDHPGRESKVRRHARDPA